MDEFLIKHGMTHPPIWMMWAVVIWVFPRAVLVIMWRFYESRNRWKDWGKDFK